jgi:hypothetical protein
MYVRGQATLRHRMCVWNCGLWLIPRIRTRTAPSNKYHLGLRQHREYRFARNLGWFW